ncbi:MAG: type I phosphomannose isomerase catalytic subunit [Bacteroidota bacterium]
MEVQPQISASPLADLATTDLHPLRFQNQFLEKLWGGQKIKSVFGKENPSLANCGETWEVSGVPGRPSVVAEGPLAGYSLAELTEHYGPQLLGEQNHRTYGTEFPLLVKLIDAADDLSVQVHPDDALARERHGSFGKTEMWYVLDADPEAQLIAGFNQPMTQERYLQAMEEGNLSDFLNREAVSPGDVFFIPAGRIHTIGRGILLAEIQQSSDVTYRIYDFDRRDADGNLRELHTEQAVAALDYAHYPQYKHQVAEEPNVFQTLVDSPFFTVQRLSLDISHTISEQTFDSFEILLAVKGALVVKTDQGSCTLKAGEALLMPAVIPHYTLEPKGPAQVLRAFIR